MFLQKSEEGFLAYEFPAPLEIDRTLREALL